MTFPEFTVALESGDVECRPTDPSLLHLGCWDTDTTESQYTELPIYTHPNVLELSTCYLHVFVN